MATGRVQFFATVAAGGNINLRHWWPRSGRGDPSNRRGVRPTAGRVGRGGQHECQVPPPHVAAVVDGKIDVCGGDSAGNYLKPVEAYDPQVGSWQQVAPMPQARYRHAAAVMGGKEYVSGGYEGGNLLSTRSWCSIRR